MLQKDIDERPALPEFLAGHRLWLYPELVENTPQSQ